MIGSVLRGVALRDGIIDAGHDTFTFFESKKSVYARQTDVFDIPAR